MATIQPVTFDKVKVKEGCKQKNFKIQSYEKIRVDDVKRGTNNFDEI